MSNQIKEYTLHLTEADLRVLSDALGGLPLRVALPVVQKIQLQISAADASGGEQPPAASGGYATQGHLSANTGVTQAKPRSKK